MSCTGSAIGSKFTFQVPRDLRELLQKSQKPFHEALGFEENNCCKRMKDIERGHFNFSKAAHDALEADQLQPAPEKKEVSWLTPFIIRSIVGTLGAEGVSSLLSRGFPLQFPRSWKASYILPIVVGLAYGALRASTTQAVSVKPKDSENLTLTAKAELQWIQAKLTWLNGVLESAHKELDTLTDDKAIGEKNDEIFQLTRLQVYFQGITARNYYRY
jgi:hypothetical protein